jgi:predicted phosphodiesterase
MRVLITGDLHNEFSKLNALINKKKPEIVICCGDFGYWPNKPWAAPLSNIEPQGCKILWCDGNHEDHWALRDRTTDELEPNIIYMPRGSTFELEDGRTIFFMGGADSIDKAHRTLGDSWFPEEVVRGCDLQNLPDVNVDIFITHTCPMELVNEMLEFNSSKFGDPSPRELTELWKIYKPDLWFFGHWHVYKEMDMFGTKCYALGTSTYPDYRWWMWLPEKEGR